MFSLCVLVRMRLLSLERLASKFAAVLGTSWAFLCALLLVFSWILLAEPKEQIENPRMFLVELTGMFIFIHLFLIQRTHNKDIKALHLKLDELIASKEGASNKLIKAENASEAVIDELHQAYCDLANSVDHPTRTIAVDERNHSE
jgi:low affinity Fe/Cu permease